MRKASALHEIDHSDSHESTGVLHAACSGVISSSRQLASAEIGLTVEQGKNIFAHPLYPSYCMLVRLLELSIEDYHAATCELVRDAEIEFWRDSRMFMFYGLLVCEMEQVLHDRSFTLDDLRRGAEGRMGLAKGALAPQRPLDLKEEQALACQVGEKFAYIAKEVGHIPDPEADKRFESHRGKHVSPLKLFQERATQLSAVPDEACIPMVANG